MFDSIAQTNHAIGYQSYMPALERSLARTMRITTEHSFLIDPTGIPIPRKVKLAPTQNGEFLI